MRSLVRQMTKILEKWKRIKTKKRVKRKQRKDNSK
jgi:hypothetical protein